MKTLIFDQFEFEDWCREERLEISTSERREFSHPTLSSFADSILGRGEGVKLPLPKPFSTLRTFALDAHYLKKYANFDVPDACDWLCYVVRDDWNDRHLIFDLGNFFVSMNWSTSA
jgi:hypothetical protein